MAEIMGKLTQDPATYIAERMAVFDEGSDSADPELIAKLNPLLEKAGQGDQAAALQVQKILANREMEGRKFFLGFFGEGGGGICI